MSLQLPPQALKQKPMKKIFLFVIFSISCYFLQSQTNVYHPFPDANAYWFESSWSDDGTCFTNDDHNVYIDGDTTIGSFTYHKLYQNGWLSYLCPSNPLPPYYYSPTFRLGFRQDIPNRRVYICQNGLDILAYDFNLNVGDTVNSPALGPGGIVVLIDSVLIGNNYNKRFWLNPDSLALIEGVGSTHGAFAYLPPPFESGSKLGCLKVNNQTSWGAISGSECTVISTISGNQFNQNATIFPNPFSKTATINFGQQMTSGKLVIYNSLGQEMESISNIAGYTTQLHRDNLPEGLYFLQLTQENVIPCTLKVFVKD